MAQDNISIEKFNELINDWNGQSIKITKNELDDIDELLIELNNVAYEKNTRRIDDYEPMHALQLHGDGKIKTDNNEFIPIPASLYEIPLEDDSVYMYDGSRLYLHTERGDYTIEKAPQDLH